MRRSRYARWMRGFLFVLMFFSSTPVFAQTFNSGSTGALGALNPSSNTAVPLPPDGVLNYTTVNIPTGVTVTFTPNASNTPVTLLATGDVTIAGTVSVNGIDGIPRTLSGPNVNPGSPGGPGGFAGGNGGLRGAPDPGKGGQGPGGAPSSSTTVGNHGTYGAPASFVALIPLFGGSGGSGSSYQNSNPTIAGGSGGGGGGAVVIASSTTITVTGSITANGGKGGMFGSDCSFGQVSGSGSGGAIRLVASQILGAGTLFAVVGQNPFCNFTAANQGRIRLEANSLSFTGTSTPGLVSAPPGPVTPASTPPLVSPPTLRITSVGGISMPTNPVGSPTTPDVSLPAGVTNPVAVALAAANTPVPTTFTVQVIDQSGNVSAVNSAPSSGTFANSTATANVTLPSSQTSLLIVFASFTIPPNVASLFPLIDGEAVERVMVTAAYGEPSTVTLITRSGKEVPADSLVLSSTREDQ